MIFDTEGFRAFCQKMGKIAPVVSFREYSSGPAIILRHDVDLDVEMAVSLARREAALGLGGVYFFLVSCPTYNVLDVEVRRMIREIADLGFEVGLHFDPTLYHDTELEEAVKKEAEILSFATGQDITSVSLHNPSVHGRFPLFQDFLNAYDPKFFDDPYYLSDSCRQFRGKDPFTFIELAKERMVQVLLHPMHYAADGGGYDKIMRICIEGRLQSIEQQFSVNKTFVREVKSLKSIVCSGIGDIDLS